MRRKERKIVMDAVSTNRGEVVAQQAPSQDFISGWLEGHKAQAAKLAEAARTATENISAGSSVETEFNNLCWTIYHAWKRDGKKGAE